MPTTEAGTPFRWDLVTPDQLGSLLSGITAPNLWFLDDLLAEAAALVAYGRSRPGRHALARAISREPSLAQPWLRTLVTELNTGGAVPGR